MTVSEREVIENCLVRICPVELAPFSFLDEVLGLLKCFFPEKNSLWGISPQIDCSAVVGLVDDKWKVEKTSGRSSYCIPDDRLILIGSCNRRFDRDVALCHELVHAVYQDTSDGLLFFECLDKRVLVEWLARKWRADSEFLGTALRSFGLEHQVYDRSSYYACYPDSSGACPFDSVIMDSEVSEENKSIDYDVILADLRKIQ